MGKHIEIVKEFLTAFSEENRNEFVENILSADFTFSAPPDPLLDRDGFLRNAGRTDTISLKLNTYAQSKVVMRS